MKTQHATTKRKSNQKKKYMNFYSLGTFPRHTIFLRHLMSSTDCTFCFLFLFGSRICQNGTRTKAVKSFRCELKRLLSNTDVLIVSFHLFFVFFWLRALAKFHYLIFCLLKFPMKSHAKCERQRMDAI